MLITCQIDWREVGVAFELQCLRNCTLSSLFFYSTFAQPNGAAAAHQMYTGGSEVSLTTDKTHHFDPTLNIYSWSIL